MNTSNGSQHATDGRVFRLRFPARKWQGLLVATATFAVLLLWNLPHLSNPPYWDDILGLHNQALWLAKHNFDIVQLWSSGSFWEGGSLVYRFGILPCWHGLLYHLFSPTTAHLAGRLANIACLAGTCGIFFSIIRRFADGWVALLWCAAALCEPVMAGSSAALGQEVPLTFAVALAIYALSKEKYRLTLFLLVFAMLIKMTAIIPLLALLVWLLFLHYTPRHWFAFPPCRPGLKIIVATAITALAAIAVMLRFEVDYQFGEWSLSLPDKVFVQIPLLTPIQGLMLLAMAMLALRRAFIISSRCGMITRRDIFALFLLIMCDGFWMSLLVYSAMLPRYTAVIVFPMFAFSAIMVGDKRFSTVLAIVFVLFGSLNWHGRFMRPLPDAHRRSGEYLERSREYLEDIALNLRACSFLEQHHAGRPIVAKWPFVQKLTLPEMGYVRHPLPGVYDAAGVPARYTGAKQFAGADTMPPETLYLFVANSFEFWLLFGPPLMPDIGDQVIYHESGLGGFFLIYQKNGRTE